MTSDAMSAKGIKAQIPHPILTRVFGKPTNKQIKTVICKMLANLMAISCKWGHSKGHLGILQDPAIYLACNGEAFNIPHIEPMTYPVIRPSRNSNLIPSRFASVFKMALFSTNPYNNFQSTNSKEYIALDKGAKQDFCPKTCFNIIHENSDDFSAEMETYSTQFGCRSLLNVPPNCDNDAADGNIIIYKQPFNKFWNKMTDDIIAKNANKVWGTHNWMISTTKIINKLSAARGKVGIASILTKSGKKKFMERWKTTILAHHVMALLTPNAQATIKIQENSF
jgi:hypothetical protein